VSTYSHHDEITKATGIMVVYAIEEECSDAHYGWFPVELFKSIVDAERRMYTLKNINKGITYRLNTMAVR
jgi:hypothetical protein